MWEQKRNSNSQLKNHTNDVEASMFAFKEIHLSFSHKAEIAENQTQNLIQQLTEL
jgi:hypothetical protein